MIPTHVINKLRCGLCKNSLSIFPIYSYGSNDTVTCGRCSAQKDFEPRRELLYEELAQYIEFPCRYQNNGCIEKLKPEDLEIHENNCAHKPCLCPILPLGTCKWEGEHKDLLEHCQDVHPALTLDFFLIELDIANPNEQNFVFSQANETFIAQLKSDTWEHKFYCNVRYCGVNSAAKQFSYRLCFLGNKKKYCCQVLPVQPGEIGPIITENTTVISVFDILDNLNFPFCATCRIDIFVKKNGKKETEVTVPKEACNILKKLECPVCFEFMVPPIMQCNAGHSFCQSCWSNLPNCPICKSTITDTRNYLLEEIANIIDYPCKYLRYGCNFFGNAGNITDHQATCDNGPYTCIIDNCAWEDKHSELIKHLNEAHKDNILETDTITYIIDATLDTESYNYIVILGNNIVKVRFIKTELNFLWELNTANKNDDCHKFTLIMDFSSQSGERLYVEKKQIPLFIDFDKNQLTNFIENDTLTYKMRLIETTEFNK